MADAMAREAAADGTNQPGQAQGSYIAAIVKAGDQDRYWSGLLLPDPARGAAFTIYAFNIELARIGEQAREPQLGEIRLEWWREALACPNGAATGNPIADALITARAAYDLPLDRLSAMIDARLLDVRRESIRTMDDLRDYLLGTAGAVFRLGAEVAGAQRDAAAEAIQEAAMAYGLTGLMRALPYHRSRGQLYLPADFLAAFGVEPEAVLRGEDSEALRTALGVLRARALDHLAAFRRLAPELPASTLPVFLPLALVPGVLRRLGAPAHRPLTDVAHLNPLGRFARIWLSNMRGRV
jgi:15-cis-phytoene synthase